MDFLIDSVRKNDMIMLIDEKPLAKAIMRGDSRIEIDGYLSSCVEKIQSPSSVVWDSVFATLIATAFCGFFAVLAFPVLLALCGGVGGIVFMTLGAKGLMFAYRMASAVKTADVLNKLRDNYTMEYTKDEKGNTISATLIHK